MNIQKIQTKYFSKSIFPDLEATHETKKKEDEKAKSAHRPKAAKRSKRNRKRAMSFCVGHSNIWKTPIHKTIKTLRDKHTLKWLRTSYHRFTK